MTSRMIQTREETALTKSDSDQDDPDVNRPIRITRYILLIFAKHLYTFQDREMESKKRKEITGVSEETSSPKQAIILADLHSHSFYQITSAMPKVLMPLVNTPIIDYTLAWLDQNGVEEVFIFCRYKPHIKPIQDYLDGSKWLCQQNLSIKVIQYDPNNAFPCKELIHGDFLLVGGDTISNFLVKDAYENHKHRRKNDSTAIVTMAAIDLLGNVENADFGYEDVYMHIDPYSERLLYYKVDLAFIAEFFVDGPLPKESLLLDAHNYKQDSNIYICSQESIALIATELQYDNLHYMVNGLFAHGYKVFVHQIEQCYYVARVNNFVSYSTITNDILLRRAELCTADVRFLEHQPSRLERKKQYVGSGAKISPIGEGTVIDRSSNVYCSVIGKGCIIGRNVMILHSIIWDNVTIEDDSYIHNSLLCGRSHLKKSASLDNAIVSYEVNAPRTEYLAIKCWVMPKENLRVVELVPHAKLMEIMAEDDIESQNSSDSSPYPRGTFVARFAPSVDTTHSKFKQPLLGLPL